MLQRNGLKAAFVAGIDGLLNAQIGGDFSLAEICVLAQIPDSLKIHGGLLKKTVCSGDGMEGVLYIRFS